MALVQCRECGIAVSSEAPACVRCGVPQPGGVSAPVPIYGLDPDTHRWLYEQLLNGVPRAPLVEQLVDMWGITRSGAREIVSQVESQALAAVTPGTPARKSGGNIAPALLSLWIPGLGQLTQGRVGRGFAMFGATALLWVILLGWIMHLTAAVDAARWDPID